MAGMNTTEKCFMLSSKIMSLGENFGGSEERVIFNLLAEYSSELGAGINAMAYLPAASMRAEQAVELVKCVQKVIYNLNLARRDGLFPDAGLEDMLSLAISVANDITVMVEQYCLGVQPVVPVTFEGGDDPDGFDLPYNDKK